MAQNILVAGPLFIGQDGAKVSELQFHPLKWRPAVARTCIKSLLPRRLFKLGCSQRRAILRLLRFLDFFKIYSIYFIIDKLVLNLDTIGIYRCRQAQPETRAELNLAVWPRSALPSAPYTALSAGTLQILFIYVYIKHA